MATYIGNDDFRGWLAYLASTGDMKANSAITLGGNGYTDNNGVVDNNVLMSQGAQQDQILEANNYIRNAYEQWQQRDFAPTVAGGGGSTAAPDTTGEDLAYLDDQEKLLRDMLGSAQRTRQQGYQQINDDYNKAKNRSDLDRASAQEGFVTKREDTTRDKMGAIDKVNSGARSLADMARRLIGGAAGRYSSAFQFAAPSAISRVASGQRTDVNENFGRNLRDIDTAESSTMTRFNQFLEDLLSQRNERRSGLEEGVLQQEQGINRDLAEVARQRAMIQGGGYSAVRRATAPFQTAISERQSQLDNLFSRFRTPYKTQPVEVSAPNLSDYTYDKAAVNAINQGGQQDYSPYSAFLRKKFQQNV